MLLLHALCFQIPENHLHQLHHNYSNTKVSPPQQIIWVWSCTIRPGTAATQVQWRPECSTTQGLCRSERSQKPNGYLWGSEKVHGNNCNHEDSLANIIRWQVVNGWRSVGTCHWRSGLSTGVSQCFCGYTIGLSIAQQSISHNRSANMRSCKSWILFNALLSDLQYWLPPKICIIETEDKDHSRRVGWRGTSYHWL